VVKEKNWRTHQQITHTEKCERMTSLYTTDRLRSNQARGRGGPGCGRGQHAATPGWRRFLGAHPPHRRCFRRVLAGRLQEEPLEKLISPIILSSRKSTDPEPDARVRMHRQNSQPSTATAQPNAFVSSAKTSATRGAEQKTLFFLIFFFGPCVRTKCIF